MTKNLLIGAFVTFTACIILTRSDDLLVSNHQSEYSNQNTIPLSRLKRQNPSPFSRPTLPPIEEVNNLRKSIFGEPGVDYPIFRFPPVTSFSCLNRKPGYYADIEARCQVFRVCSNTDLTTRGFAFLCPNGTLFNQKVFVCDWYVNVNCKESENFYTKNTELDMKIGSIQDIMTMARKIISFPANVSTLPEISTSNPITSTTQQIIQPVTKPFAISSTIKPMSIISTTQATTTIKELPMTTTLPQTNLTNDKKQQNITTSNQNEKLNPNIPIKEINDLDTPPQNQFFNPEQIYVSSLGELSTDVGNEFDINKVTLLDTSDDSDVKFKKTSSALESANFTELVAETFSRKSAKNNKNRKNATSQEILLSDLIFEIARREQDKKDKPLNHLNENDPFQALRRILQRNPTQNEIDAVFSGEADLLSQVIFEVVKKGRIESENGIDAINSGEADLIQIIEYVLQRKLHENEIIAILSGEGNLLSQVIDEVLVRGGNSIQSETLLQILRTAIHRIKANYSISNALQRLLQRNPTKDEINAVFSGEADLLSQVIFEIVQIEQNKEGNTASNSITSGEADLIQIIEYVLKRQLNSNEIYAVFSGEANLLSQIINRVSERNTKSPESENLLRLVESVLIKIKQEKSIKNIYEPLQRLLQRSPTQDELKAIISGEANLLSHVIFELVKRAPKNEHQIVPYPIYSGQADLIQIIEYVLHRKLEENEINAIFSGEADLLSHIINDVSKQNIKSPETTKLLRIFEEAYLKVKYHEYNSNITVNTAHVTNGNDPFAALQRILQRNPTQEEMNAIFGGEANLLSQVLFEVVRRAPRTENSIFYNEISSGEADLIQIIEHVLKRKLIQNEITAIFSGKGNLLSQVITETFAQNTHTPNSEKLLQILRDVIDQRPNIMKISKPIENIPSSSISPISNTYIPASMEDLTEKPVSKQIFTYPTTTDPRTIIATKNGPMTTNKNNDLHNTIGGKSNLNMDLKINLQTASINDQTQNNINPMLQYQTETIIDGNNGQQSLLTAYILKEIENRPPSTTHIPQPPFQSVYPAIIQNNYIETSPLLKRPISLQPYNISASLPSSLPTIVHEFNNILMSNNKGMPPASQVASSHFQSLPIITTTYNNRDNGAREKVVVKVVKAPGWYLNDEDERKSYFNALKHGLLGNNGYVYVNNVQKDIDFAKINAERGDNYTYKPVKNQLNVNSPLRSISTQNFLNSFKLPSSAVSNTFPSSISSKLNFYS